MSTLIIDVPAAPAGTEWVKVSRTEWANTTDDQRLRVEAGNFQTSYYVTTPAIDQRALQAAIKAWDDTDVDNSISQAMSEVIRAYLEAIA